MYLYGLFRAPTEIFIIGFRDAQKAGAVNNVIVIMISYKANFHGV
jgi:hypothetical protein